MHASLTITGAGRVDTSSPATQQLRPLADRSIVDAKLDFLFAGAVPGRRHADFARKVAYRLVGDIALLVQDAVATDVSPSCASCRARPPDGVSA